ncbi:MAG: nuclear transport factor 2 family protein [Terriglobales bacterium]
MRTRLALLLLALTLLPSLVGQTKPGARDVKTAVEQVLRTQQDAWNRHDLEAFMAGYWNSPDLTFFSGAQRTSGWQGALDRYRKTYQSAGKEMGKLEFSGLQIEPLASDAAFVRGQWYLTLSDGKTPHGLFTLIFRKFSNGWKIVHDHTSAAE